MPSDEVALPRSVCTAGPNAASRGRSRRRAVAIAAGVAAGLVVPTAVFAATPVTAGCARGRSPLRTPQRRLGSVRPWQSRLTARR